MSSSFRHIKYDVSVGCSKERSGRQVGKTGMQRVNLVSVVT